MKVARFNHCRLLVVYFAVISKIIPQCFKFKFFKKIYKGTYNLYQQIKLVFDLLIKNREAEAMCVCVSIASFIRSWTRRSELDKFHLAG